MIKFAENYLLHPSTKSIQTLIAEIIHPNEQDIHKNPPSSIAHKRKRPRRLK
jgi:hypothetical protein